MIDAALRQQLPTGDGQDVAHEVTRVLSTDPYTAVLILDIEARVASGEQKYGVRLKTNNGRDVDLDIYQELLDSMNYAMQAFLQTGVRDYLDIFNQATALAVRMKTILSARDAIAQGITPVNQVA